MINCLIVDDEEHAIDLLKLHIAQMPFLKLLNATTSPVKALQLIHEEKTDLIFLDVHMPEMSGMEFLQLLNGRCKVILTTAYKDYALQGFDHEVIDYLLKPITFTRFLKAAQRALALQPVATAIPEENDYMLVKTDFKGKLVKINLEDIVYIEGLKHYVRFCTRQGQRLIALLNIKDLEERLGGDQFIRVHKSFILAIKYIVMIQGNMVHLEHTDSCIPIGNTYRELFMTKMKDKIMTK